MLSNVNSSPGYVEMLRCSAVNIPSRTLPAVRPMQAKKIKIRVRMRAISLGRDEWVAGLKLLCLRDACSGNSQGELVLELTPVKLSLSVLSSPHFHHCHHCHCLPPEPSNKQVLSASHSATDASPFRPPGLYRDPILDVFPVSAWRCVQQLVCFAAWPLNPAAAPRWVRRHPTLALHPAAINLIAPPLSG